MTMVLAGAFVTLTGFGTLIGALLHLEQTHEQLTREHLQSAELSGRLRHLDEVLTSSALLASTTGDDSWRRRYDRHVTAMDDALAQALRQSGSTEARHLTDEVSAANDELIALELLAFEFVEAGRLEQAWAAVSGPEYQLHKRLLREGVDELTASVAGHSATVLADLRDRLRAWLVVGVFFLIASCLLWLGLVSRLRRVDDDQSRTAESLEAERSRAQTATQAKAQFLAHMSHEIRTPLNGVLGMCQLLDDTELSGEQQETLDVIKSSGESLLNILEDILDFSKIEAGQLEIEHVPFDASRCVQDVCALMAMRAREKGIHLRHRIDAGLPPRLMGDPSRLRQVIINLVNNAVKFTQDGGVEVILLADAIGERSVNVLLEVRDTGVGIAAEHVERVFHEFDQLDPSTARHFGGSGLGLPICRQLVELMGGRIGVESTVGSGSTFRVLLPMVVAPGVEIVSPATRLTQPGVHAA